MENAISDLDPESIENVSILKGPTCSCFVMAFAELVTGVVLITQKRQNEKEKDESLLHVPIRFDVPYKFLEATNRFCLRLFFISPEIPRVGKSNIMPQLLFLEEIQEA